MRILTGEKEKVRFDSRHHVMLAKPIDSRATAFFFVFSAKTRGSIMPAEGSATFQTTCNANSGGGAAVASLGLRAQPRGGSNFPGRYL